ncbi:MAG: hypothetical protein MRY32_05345 [Rickettsiales bacterium]|nr:hypothetical protein [Rickettsiales bacterium]
MSQLGTEKKQAEIINLQEQDLLQLLDIKNDDPETVVRAVRKLKEQQTELEIKNDYLERDIERVVRYLERMQHDIFAIEHSVAWRIGFRLVSFVKRILGRKSGNPIFANLRKQLETYHHWKKSRD